MLKLDPGYDEAIYNLAEMHRDSAPDEAEELYRKSLEIDPNYAEAVSRARVSFLLYQAIRKAGGSCAASTKTKPGRLGRPFYSWQNIQTEKEFQGSKGGAATRCGIGGALV